MDGENDDIPLSALQHYLFCPRQCALIHVERQWAEDAATVEGRILHERADQPGASRRRGVRSVRSLPLRCVRLGLSGIGVSFLTDYGRFQARVEGPMIGDVLLRRRQYRASDEAAESVALVGAMVAGKAANQRAVLRRALRDHGGGGLLQRVRCTDPVRESGVPLYGVLAPSAVGRHQRSIVLPVRDSGG